MMSVFIESAGIVAPGLAGWAAAAPVLRGQAPYQSAELSNTPPELLPANERRRASASVRLAFVVAEDAVRGSGRVPAELATVFATSEADTVILHRLCTALAQQQRVLSPTDFHNSVHNAAAGYWSIATACKQPSASISAYDATFIAGLLETAALVHDTGGALLVCYDIAPPGPLHAARPLAAPCAAALVVARERGPRTLARLEIERSTDAESRMNDAALEQLRAGNPAGRALPLLRALALNAPGAVTVAGVGASRFRLGVTPC